MWNYWFFPFFRLSALCVGSSQFMFSLPLRLSLPVCIFRVYSNKSSVWVCGALIPLSFSPPHSPPAWYISASANRFELSENKCRRQIRATQPASKPQREEEWRRNCSKTCLLMGVTWAGCLKQFLTEQNREEEKFHWNERAFREASLSIWVAETEVTAVSREFITRTNYISHGGLQCHREKLNLETMARVVNFNSSSECGGMFQYCAFLRGLKKNKKHLNESFSTICNGWGASEQMKAQFRSPKVSQFIVVYDGSWGASRSETIFSSPRHDTIMCASE